MTDTNQGQTSRELRVWPQQKLLMVMYCHYARLTDAVHRSAPLTCEETRRGARVARDGRRSLVGR